MGEITLVDEALAREVARPRDGDPEPELESGSVHEDEEGCEILSTELIDARFHGVYYFPDMVGKGKGEGRGEGRGGRRGGRRGEAPRSGRSPRKRGVSAMEAMVEQEEARLNRLLEHERKASTARETRNYLQLHSDEKRRRNVAEQRRRELAQAGRAVFERELTVKEQRERNLARRREAEARAQRFIEQNTLRRLDLHEDKALRDLRVQARQEIRAQDAVSDKSHYRKLKHEAAMHKTIALERRRQFQVEQRLRRERERLDRFSEQRAFLRERYRRQKYLLEQERVAAQWRDTAQRGRSSRGEPLRDRASARQYSRASSDEGVSAPQRYARTPLTDPHGQARHYEDGVGGDGDEYYGGEDEDYHDYDDYFHADDPMEPEPENPSYSGLPMDVCQPFRGWEPVQPAYQQTQRPPPPRHRAPHQQEHQAPHHQEHQAPHEAPHQQTHQAPYPHPHPHQQGPPPQVASPAAHGRDSQNSIPPLQAPGPTFAGSVQQRGFPPETVWYYVDTSNVIQGPFPQDRMRQWNVRGLFPDGLLVQANGAHPDRFARLVDIYPDPPQAFLSL